jgi:uncharacterized membrane-anchored protein YitT (DUF2179 family)
MFGGISTMLKKFHIKQLRQLFVEITGSILVAAAIYNFALNANFPMTGFSGISIILYRLFGLPIGLSTILLNIPVTIICYKLLGKKFLFSSLRCMVISSFFMDYVAPLFPVYEGSRLLAALCTGVIGGIGYSMIYMENSSTGGTDFITMSIKSINPHVPLGKIVFITDTLVVFIGGVLFKDIDGIIYGMIVSYLFSIVIDKMMDGINAGKLTLIVTDHGKMICDVIDKCCGRGSTIIEGQGGFRNDNRQVVMCACSNKEMYQIQNAVKEADPNSFLIILESNEVHGEGFHVLKIGEKQ